MSSIYMLTFSVDNWLSLSAVVVTVVVGALTVLYMRKASRTNQENITLVKKANDTNDAALKLNNQSVELSKQAVKSNEEAVQLSRDANLTNKEAVELNQESELRNQKLAHVILKISIDKRQQSQKMIPVLKLSGEEIRKVIVYPITIEVLSGSLESAYPIVSYFEMSKQDSGGFLFNQLEHNVININGDFPTFEAMSDKLKEVSQEKHFSKGPQQPSDIGKKKNNEASISPDVASGFIVDGDRLIFAQSYLLLGSDGSRHLVMLWYDSQANDGKPLQGYLDAVRSIANDDMMTPQWARSQYRSLRKYLYANNLDVL